ncbi:MAG: ankyrin repeat domain-containing protein, partial [Thermodesulfobacteriota bacterium]
IRGGADVNARDTFDRTALMFAALTGNPEVIFVLLKHGADASLTDNRWETAFDYAKGNPKIKNTKAYWKLNELQYSKPNPKGFMDKIRDLF